MSSLDNEITEPGRPELREVSPGVYAYIQPDGSCWTVYKTGGGGRLGDASTSLWARFMDQSRRKWLL